MTALPSTSPAVSMMSAAISYASVGMRVFPVDPLGKKPLVRDNLAVATANKEQVMRWWSKWPTAMIGFTTGALDGETANGIIIIDVDNGNGGYETLAALEKELGPLPRSLVAQTPSGGLHIWLSWPAGVRIKSLVGKFGLGTGVDVRGCLANGTSKGYVIAAPSRRADGNAYRWAERTSYPLLCDAPGEISEPWLFALAFSERERTQLAKFDITGPQSLAGVSPVDWQCVAYEKLADKWRQTSNVPVGPLSLDASKRLRSYIEKGVECELAKVREACAGEQETTASHAGLNLNALIKGADVCGLNTIALESDVAKRFCAAVVAMVPGDIANPWNDTQARDKWERAAEAAEPRSLFHVGYGERSDDQFKDVFTQEDSAASHLESQPTKSMLEFAADISLDNIVKRQSRALVRGLLHPGETAMLYGQSGAGKSFLALDLAWHVALDREWHGNRVKQAPVLYVCLEGVDGFRKRMLAYQTSIGDPGNEFARLALHVSLVKADAGKKGAESVITAAQTLSAKAGRAVGLVIIDTLARAMAGDDENATGDMMHFVEQRAGLIARRSGAAVIIVHHTNAGGTARGSGSLTAGCETVLRADRNGDKRTLSAEKVKDGAERALFHYTLDNVHLGFEDDGSAITSCVVSTTPVDLLRPAKRKEDRDPKPLRVFKDSYNAIEARMPGELGVVHKLSIADVKAEFESRYATGESDPKTARQTKDRSWRRALNYADQLFETRDEMVWRLNSQANESAGDPFGLVDA